MSIYDYTKKGAHPAGYRGYRVSVMVDNVHKQKYLSTRDKTKEEIDTIGNQADGIHEQWKILQEAAEKRRVANAIPPIPACAASRLSQKSIP